MPKIKYCPHCKKQVDNEIKVCECGYEFMMNTEITEGKTTLIGYNSKKQLYIFLVIGLLAILTVPFVWIFNREKVL